MLIGLILLIKLISSPELSRSLQSSPEFSRTLQMHYIIILTSGLIRFIRFIKLIGLIVLTRLISSPELSRSLQCSPERSRAPQTSPELAQGL